MVTLRTIIEQFPDTPQSMAARHRLAIMLTGMNRHLDAAQVLEDLGARFPDNPVDVWFRLGELYERRLKRSGESKRSVREGATGLTHAGIILSG